MTEIIKDPLTKDECILWIAKLRSGEIEQGQRQLRLNDGSMCCLGVLATVCNIDFIPDRSVLDSYSCGLERRPGEVEYVKLEDYHQWRLCDMNDVLGKSFNEIADSIETEILPTLER